MSKGLALAALCPLAPPLADGACAWCGTELPARRKSWCSDACSDAFWTNHWWSVARAAAKKRDKYRCRRCGTRAPIRPTRAKCASDRAYREAMRAWREAKRTGRMEVNHIAPALGRHRELSCAHHLENLETLCVPCHKEHTAALAAARRKPAANSSASAPPP